MDASDGSRDKRMPEPTSKGTIDRWIWAIIAIQLIVGTYGFIVLPSVVPIHWGIDGHPNGYGPKWVGMLLYPVISIAIYVLVRVLLAAGPRLGGRESTTANIQVAKLVLVGITLFMLVLQLVIVVASLGRVFDMTTVIMVATSVLFIFIGNYMGKMRRNFWMGIRTPYTLANSVVWERTHRLGGWLFVAMGLIGILCSFVPALRLWGVIVPLVAVVVFLYIYSYVCYRQQTRGEYDS